MRQLDVKYIQKIVTWDFFNIQNICYAVGRGCCLYSIEYLLKKQKI
jgi:hypothetical protein